MKDDDKKNTKAGVMATSIEDSDEEQKIKAASTNFVHIGALPSTDTAHVGNTSSPDAAHIGGTHKKLQPSKEKQTETDGSGAILGAIVGVGLGIAAGLAMGPLAPFALPALAIAGYFAGMYAGDNVEAGVRGLSEGSFTDRIKNFMKDRLVRIDRTIGGVVGLVIGAALSPVFGPIAPMALPFLMFYGNRIGTELGEMAAPTLMNAFQKVAGLIKDYRNLSKEKNPNISKEIDQPKNEISKDTPNKSNSISAISSEDLKKAEAMRTNFQTHDSPSNLSLPQNQNRPKGMGKG